MTVDEMQKKAQQMGNQAKSISTIGGNPHGGVLLAQTAATWEMVAELCLRLELLADAMARRVPMVLEDEGKVDG